MRAELPPRLRPPRIEPDELRRFAALGDEIENRVTTGDDGKLPALLAEWNARAHRRYDAREFKTYYGAMSTEDFVRGALAPGARFIDDLRFDEARDAIRAVTTAALSQSDTDYVLDLLEKNLPGSVLSDLIFWPNEWFRDESMLQVEMTPEQIVGYAMKRSGRLLDGTPTDLQLPWPMPV